MRVKVAKNDIYQPCPPLVEVAAGMFDKMMTIISVKIINDSPSIQAKANPDAIYNNFGRDHITVQLDILDGIILLILLVRTRYFLNN